MRVLEYQPLEIEVRTGAGVASTPEVRLGGVPIGLPEVAAEAGRLSWRWTFRSESWCGRAILTVAAGEEPAEFEIVSVPDGSKFSEDEYGLMLDKVLAYGRDLAWGLAPGQGTGTLSAGSPLGATHPAIVAQHLGPLMAQLRLVLASPVLAQRVSDRVVPFRPDLPVTPAVARWFATRPDGLERVRRGETRVALRQHRRSDCWDHPANRYLVALLRRLASALRRTADALSHHASWPLAGDFEQARARDLSARTLSASAEVLSALMHPALAGLEPGEFTEGAALVFAGNPAYARVAALSRRMLGASVGLDGAGDLSACLRRSWDLFEIYCLFRLVEVLEAALGPGWTFGRAPLRRHVLSGPGPGVVWTARNRDGGEWRLSYQQRFGHSATGPSTVTKARCPDFLLRYRAPDGTFKWIVLDAKYRTAAQSVHEALESMHVYRDSLRLADGPGPATPPSGGFLLVPHVADECAKFALASFRDCHGIGLIAVGDDAAIAALVCGARGDAASCAGTPSALDA